MAASLRLISPRMVCVVARIVFVLALIYRGLHETRSRPRRARGAPLLWFKMVKCVICVVFGFVFSHLSCLGFVDTISLRFYRRRGIVALLASCGTRGSSSLPF